MQCMYIYKHASPREKKKGVGLSAYAKTIDPCQPAQFA